MGSRLDLTSMYATHDALRRDLEHIARITARPTDDPRHVLRTAVGWQMFKTYLRNHHTAEDEALYPPMEQALADRPDDLAVLAVLEREHAVIDPLLDAVDGALADRARGPERLGRLVDALVTGLSAHLRLEEDEALPLVDATVTEQQWRHFGEVGTRLVGDGRPRHLPWLLDGASAERTAHLLGRLPDDVRLAYENEWRPAYADLPLWQAAR